MEFYSCLCKFKLPIQCCVYFFFALLTSNILITLNRTTHSSVLLLCVVQFNVNKTLPNLFYVNESEHGFLDHFVGNGKEKGPRPSSHQGSVFCNHGILKWLKLLWEISSVFVAFLENLKFNK